MEKYIFKIGPDRGYTITAIDQEGSNAKVKVELDGNLVREFDFPAYKIWNIQAHADDIIRSEIEKNVDGYLIAGSNGLGGNVF